MKTKLLFLDIDGVLNHQLFYEEKNQIERHKEVGYPMCDIDFKKIELLNQFVKDTRVKIVSTSTWRKNITLEGIQQLFKDAGFKGEIIGVTSVLKMDNATMPRGVEIYEYLESCQTIDIPYVIFDDDSDMLLSQKKNFFLVDSYCGLTLNIIRKATNFLNGKSDYKYA